MDVDRTDSESGVVAASDEEKKLVAESRYDLTNLALSDVVRCGFTIGQMASDARSMEEVANRIVNHLFTSCRNPETGESDIALVRVFKTHPFGGLDEPLQQAALAISADGQLDDSTKCLVLLATAGEQADWNDRHQSQGHRAIPLLSEEMVSQIPMIAQLVRQFGLELSSVISPAPELLVELDQRNYNVFLVERAVDSPFIPAQDQFVKPYGVRSVLGFGGMLPTGNLFTVIMFLKTELPRATAEAFRTVALKIKATILPFEDVAVFDDFSASLPADTQPAADQLLSMLRSKVAALEELEGVYDRMVIDQSGRLEQVVRDVAAANRDLQGEIESRKQAESEREKLHDQLMVASRRAGMAEIATGVLHNVGNVLNGVNVSATLLQEQLRNSKRRQLKAAVDLLDEHADDLGNFITVDERGKHFPKFLAGLANVLEREATDMGMEVDSLNSKVDHLKTIVSAQQSYATLSGASELLSISEVVEDALSIAAPSLDRHGITIVREFVDVPQVSADKQKLIQILVNLISNAKDAILETPSEASRITLKTSRCDEGHVLVEVCDTGVGIPRENLATIFAHGFTTKQDRGGHGFGLHHSANAATEMGGRLTADSDGAGQGAAFTLKLPLKKVAG